MSGFLASAGATLNSISSAAGAVSALLGGGGYVRPGSFRGVPFVVITSGGEGGRRIVTHEFPLRDLPFTEDLGRAAQKYKLKVFVLGPGYMAQRDALLSACQDDPTVGTLVHPYLGEKQVRAGVLHWEESKELGGYCAFDLEFVEDPGAPPSPLSVTDTAGGLLRGLVSLLPIITSAYAIVSMIVQHPGFLLGFVGGMLGQLADDLLGLPPRAIFGLVFSIQGLSARSNDADVAAGVLDFFTAAADNVAIAFNPPFVPDDPVSGSLPTLPAGADLSGGLMAFAAWGGGLPVIAPATPVLAARATQQAAIVALIQGAATLAVLQIYANADWPSADAAAAALGQVVDLLDTQATAAADAGLDDLYRGWQAVAAMAVQDLTRRAQQLPRLARYSLSGSLPSLVLAQRLYHDASRADEIAALNNTPHPAFMPRDGYRLVP